MERLHYLKLPTLEYRRLREDLIFVYKITYDLIDSKFEMQCNICGNIPMLQPSLDQRTGGHPYKYQIHHHPGVRNNFITARVLNTWNGLNTSTVLSNSLNIFKNNLQKDSSMPDPYDYLFSYWVFVVYYILFHISWQRYSIYYEPTVSGHCPCNRLSILAFLSMLCSWRCIILEYRCIAIFIYLFIWTIVWYYYPSKGIYWPLFR